MEDLYDQNFYDAGKGSITNSQTSARSVVPLILQLIEPKSVIDVGCGLGTWLRAFKDILPDIRVVGLDGEYNKGRVLIDADEFIGCDLEEQLPSFPSKFDLAMSLEVAEHLSPQRAQSFVRDLTSLSSAVLFSAAWPGQGGTNHINEQWHDYWVKLFADVDFTPVDCIRPWILTNRTVSGHYRSNTLLFIDKNFSGDVDFSKGELLFMGKNFFGNMDSSKGDWKNLQKLYSDNTANGFFQRVGRRLDKNFYLNQLKKILKKIF
jgi:SAM-dependent methyltransferase